MINICISGATGWTGAELVRGVLAATDMTLTGAVARRAAGQDIGTAIGDEAADVIVTPTLEQAFEQSCDVLIEYTHPDHGMANTIFAIERGVPVILGTTGLTAADIDRIDDAARASGVGVVTGNFALCAALAQHFSLFAAKYIEQFEIIDYAASTKPDAPSGTAGELAELLGDVRKPKLDLPIDQTIGPQEIRGATINGVQVHSVRLPSYLLSVESIFAQSGERLVIRHEAGSSAVPYVFGTLLAARRIGDITGVVRGLDKLLFAEESI